MRLLTVARGCSEYRRRRTVDHEADECQVGYIATFLGPPPVPHQVDKERRLRRRRGLGVVRVGLAIDDEREGEGLRAAVSNSATRAKPLS